MINTAFDHWPYIRQFGCIELIDPEKENTKCTVVLLMFVIQYYILSCWSNHTSPCIWPCFYIAQPDRNQKKKKYCGVIVVCVGPMFVASMANPCPRFYIPAYVWTSNCLIFIKNYLKLLPTTLHLHDPIKCWLPTNIDHYE